MSYMSKLKSRSVALLLAISAVFGSIAAAQQQPAPAAKQQEGKPLPPAPQPATKSATSEGKTDIPKADAKQDYSQEAVIVEKLDRALKFEEDGTGTSTTTAKFKIQTQSGVQQL